jgi:phenylalanyl-tRNA synthetase alpha chain
MSGCAALPRQERRADHCSSRWAPGRRISAESPVRRSTRCKQQLEQAIAARERRWLAGNWSSGWRPSASTSPCRAACERAGGPHPVNRALERIAIFQQAWLCVATGPRSRRRLPQFRGAELPPASSGAGDARHLLFPDGRLLRTHTSPVQIRVMERGQPPVRIIAPGKVYRSDSDQTHTPMFHQVEGPAGRQGRQHGRSQGLLHASSMPFSSDELAVRFRPSYFPFTEPSAEVDVAGTRATAASRAGWRSSVAAWCIPMCCAQLQGIDPEIYTGYAFGMGVERLAMLRYGVNDLRQFFENDLNFCASSDRSTGRPGLKIN